MTRLIGGKETALVDLLTRLRERGWRLTSQRRVIAETLIGDHVHLTADEVLAAARVRLPEIGRATVYATLRELVELGEVAEITTDRGPVRYDPNAIEPHHHLVCTDCQAVFDVVTEVPTLAAEQRHGFAIHDVDVVFRGRCSDCTSRAVPTMPD